MVYLPCPPILWQFWTPFLVPAVQCIFGCTWKQINCRTVVSNILWVFSSLRWFDLTFGTNSSPARGGLEFGYWIFQVRQTSKWSPESAVWRTLLLFWLSLKLLSQLNVSRCHNHWAGNSIANSWCCSRLWMIKHYM
jgi:hypothetical protein